MQYKILTTTDFAEQHVYRDDNQISTISHPTDAIDIRSIHVIQQSIALTGQNTPVQIFQGYDNTLIPIPQKQSRYPQATFSQYFLADTLKTIIEADENARRKSYVDMGCGAGFTGNHIAKSNIGKIVFTDLYPEALEDAIHSCMLNKNIPIETKAEEIPNGIRFATGTNYDFKVGDVTRTLQDVPFHTATSCPAFIPYICEVFPQAYEIFAAITKKGMKENNTGTSEIYFGHSSLSTHKIKEAAEKTGGVITEIKSKRMPLNISIVDNVTNGHNVPIGKILEALKPFGLEIEQRDAYHNLIVSKITFKE